MFAKTIIDSDAFLDMPISAQALYFHLSMRGDDDGFINKPKTIMRMCSCSEDDLKLLIAKKFIIPFESGIVVIKHWKIHNYIRKDTYTETKYKEEKAILELDENSAYTLECDDLVTYPSRDRVGASTQVRIGKVRLGKKEQESITAPIDYKSIAEFYNSTCTSLPSVKTLSRAREKSIKARLNKYSIEDIKKAFEMAEQSDFLKGSNDRNWTANFDWILKDANLAKVLDGNYSNKQRTTQRAKNSFNNFTGREYSTEDLNDLERKLINNQ